MILGYHRLDQKGLKRFGRDNPLNRVNFKEQLEGVIEALYHFPCIGVWVPFNERWGQFHANEITSWNKELEPTRLVDHASGWFDQGGGDFLSKHVYVKKLRVPKEIKERAFVLSEFGGTVCRSPDIYGTLIIDLVTSFLIQRKSSHRLTLT